MSAVSSAAKRILGQKISGYIRSLKFRNLPNAQEYRQRLRGRRALELGGPSEIFLLGPLPIYSALKSVDNCNYAVRTIWPGEYSPEFGRTYICEATDLRDIPDASYDCVLSSHSLEHVANPLKALYEWKRVLTPDGLLLLLLPNKEHTFDWRRSVTPLQHLIRDYEQHTGEDDLSHVNETLELHDLAKTPEAGSYEHFRERCLNNFSNRALHHHVFTLPSALEMLKHVGFEPIIAELNLPNDIIVLASISTCC